MKQLLIMLDYGTSPIWDETNINQPKINIAVADLPITAELIKRIIAWNKNYHTLFVNNSREFFFQGFASEDQRQKFIQEGVGILDALKIELPKDWNIRADINV